MIKKRTRPQHRVREKSPEAEGTSDAPVSAEHTGQTIAEEQLSLSELLELQKLRKSRQGIDSQKLNKGVQKKRAKEKEEEEGLEGGLKAGTKDDDDQDEEAEARTRKAVRSNNFTGQTNALDVDKHMMAYIEENLKIRSKPKEEAAPKPVDPHDALYNISDRWKVDKQLAKEEGSVTNSMTMLTAIPEVDLGMDTRLRNIEDTEKAKRIVAEGRQGKKRSNDDEEHLAATRFFRPNMKAKSDADIMRDAKLEAMGLPAQDDYYPRTNHERNQMATDEAVMERFKKRMRK